MSLHGEGDKITFYENEVSVVEDEDHMVACKLISFEIVQGCIYL